MELRSRNQAESEKFNIIMHLILGHSNLTKAYFALLGKMF